MKTNTLVTVIIPFLNERGEVWQTIASLSANTKQDINIIVINDASNDGYDYSLLEKMENVLYICNKRRLGVAACRDMGIDLCETDYFLLLDAHMRFYDDKWYELVVSQLKSNNRQLLCFESLPLINNSGKISKAESAIGYGAYINLDSESNHFLEVDWISSLEDNKTIIPCILGAAYACSKSYWQYLKGLNGLIEYGLDEQFISLKVWLEGGVCKLLRGCQIGHIYRQKAPYEIKTESSILNKSLITELLFPSALKYKFYNRLQHSYPELWEHIVQELLCRKEWISEQKKHISQICTRKIEEIILMNKQYWDTMKEDNKIHQIIKKSEDTLIEHLLNLGHEDFWHIWGVTILALLLSKTKGECIYEAIGGKLIDVIWSRITSATPCSFENGLLGIGWLIEYLLQHNLVDGNICEILEDVDNKLLTYNYERDSDFSIETGVMGFIFYMTARMKGANLRNEDISKSNYDFNDIRSLITNRLLVSKNNNHKLIAIELHDLLTFPTETPEKIVIEDLTEKILLSERNQQLYFMISELEKIIIA